MRNVKGVSVTLRPGVKEELSKLTSLKLTVIVFVHGHSSWLQDANFELLVDPEGDFFWLSVRNLRWDRN